MVFEIKKSRYMDLSSLNRIENYICRIPKPVREKFELLTGSYIKLKNRNNKEVILQIEPAYIEDIEQYPGFNGLFVTSYVSNLLDMQEPQLNIVKELTLGADPEGYIIDNDSDYYSVIDAEDHFNEFEIGNDCGLIEFRPNPSTTPYGLVNNLYKLIKRASYKTDRMGWDILASSSINFRPAGFHIHFGYNSGLKRHLSQIKLVGSLLDYVLAIPLLTKEVKEDRFRRGSSRYGRPGDIKRSRVSFEYRVPGGRLMESPILAIGAISIAEIVMKDFLTKCNDITNGLRNTEKFETYEQLQRVYPTLPSKDLIKEVLTNTTDTEAYISRLKDGVMRTIYSIDTYKEREKEIQRFFNYKSEYRESNLANHWKKEYKKIIG